MIRLAAVEAENAAAESTPDSSTVKAAPGARPGTSGAAAKVAGVPTPSKKGLVISNVDLKPFFVF